MLDSYRLGAALLAGLFLASAPARPAEPEAAAQERFVKQVKPLLELKCIACHGPDKQKGKLRLDSRAGLLKGGASGPAIVSGDPEASLLIQALRHGQPDLQMPPKEKLPEAQIAALSAWIKEGAAWPTTPVATQASGTGDAWSDPNNPIVKIFSGQRLDLWSLKKPVRPALPEVADTAWVRTPVDRFIAARLQAARLRPSPEADRRTLVRRLYFDLVGLPPTPEEMAQVQSDTSQDWYEKLVERLLASPRYGERWARTWLDIVRYADTNGFERDEYRPSAWRYRDYVIRSLNSDKPYDQFIREQLAGDELASRVPVATHERPEETADGLIATGYLRLGTYDSTRGLFQEDKKGHDELMADLVNTTGAAFLGLTLACCQCHNHKYDPIAQADHYRIRAFFAAVRFRDDLVAVSPQEQQRIKVHNDAIDQQTAPLQQESASLLAEVKTRIVDERLAQFSPEIIALLQTDEAGRDDVTKNTLKPYLAKLDVSDKDAAAALTVESKKRHAALEQKIAELAKHKLTPDKAMAMTDAGASAPATHVFFQGDFTQPREEVPPGFLSVLDPTPARIAAPNSNTTGRRTALANWIASPDNPLTARVLVNRLWQHHFGKGLVATPNDFGFSGAKPTHPKLLDWLAAEFTQSPRAWSIKHMHRLMVLSATYRQASADNPQRRPLDPENALLWRQNPRRLDAETLRDSLLSVSGLLRPYAGGRPLWPPVPDDMLKAQPGILEALEGHDGGRKQGWYADPLEETDVRSIFLIQKRVLPLPFLQSFDLPDTTCSCGKRNVTTVAPQALTLLNSPMAFRMARAFAGRVAREAGDDPARRVERALALALGRAPDAEEKRIGLDLLQRHAKLYAAQGKPGAETPEQRALVDFCRAVLNFNEFVYVD